MKKSFRLLIVLLALAACLYAAGAETAATDTQPSDGAPEEVAAVDGSYTGQYLKPLLR